MVFTCTKLQIKEMKGYPYLLVFSQPVTTTSDLGKISENTVSLDDGNYSSWIQFWESSILSQHTMGIFWQFIRERRELVPYSGRKPERCLGVAACRFLPSLACSDGSRHKASCSDAVSARTARAWGGRACWACLLHQASQVRGQVSGWPGKFLPDERVQHSWLLH